VSAPRGGDGGEAPSTVDLGVITRPHGVRGEVRVHPWNPDSSLLAELESVLLLVDGGPRRVRVASARKVPKGFILALEGVHGREGAEALRDVHLGLPRDELPELEEDELYLVDLVGLSVVQDGRRIGQVVEVLEYPSIECLRVECEDGFREVPLNRPWVEDVDLEAGEVRVGDLEDVPLEVRR
jgi:16S rRNA processing protein RimM